MELCAHGLAMRAVLQRTGGLWRSKSMLEPRTAAACSAAEELQTARAMVADTFPDLVCCINCELFDDPVTTDDGHTYSRVALLRWWQNKLRFTSPKTGAVLASNAVRPVFTLREHIDHLVRAVLRSGKAAALAGSTATAQAMQIEGSMAALGPADFTPSDEFLERLHRMCTDTHLRDFAARCGALRVAAACFSARQTAVTVDFLVLMLEFNQAHQESLAGMIPVAVAALSSADAELRARCWEVLAALVCDCRDVPDALLGALPLVVAPLVAADESGPVLKSALVFLAHLLVGKENNAGLRAVCNELMRLGVPGLLVRAMLADRDAQVTALACLIVRVLADASGDLKTALAGTPRLLAALETTATRQASAYFAVRALAAFSENEQRGMQILESITCSLDWALSPRRAAKEAFDAMSMYPTPKHVSTLSLCILRDSLSRTNAIVGPGTPTRAQIVDYVLRQGIEPILEAVYFACTQKHFETMHTGLSLLGNMAIFLTGRTRTRHARQIQEASTCVVEVMKIAAAQVEDEAERVQTLRDALSVLCQYIDILSLPVVAELQLKHNVIGWCQQEIARHQAPAVCSDQNVSYHYDFVCKAFSVIMCVYKKSSYSELQKSGCYIAKFLVASLDEFLTNQMINWQIAQTIQLLTCSCSIDENSGTRVLLLDSQCFAEEIVDQRAYQVLLSLLLRPGLDFQTLRLPILRMLRDVAPTLSTKQGHEENVRSLVENIVVLVRFNIASFTAYSAPTVHICLQIIANLLLGETEFPTPGAQRAPMPVSAVRDVILETGLLQELMFDVLLDFRAQDTEDHYPAVMLQALRVITLMSSVKGYASIGATQLEILAHTLNSVGAMKNIPRRRKWDDWSTRDIPKCLEAACHLVFFMLAEGPDEIRKGILKSLMVPAVITTLRKSADEQNRYLRITQGGAESCVWVLQKLQPFVKVELAIEITQLFAALLLKDNKGLNPSMDPTGNHECLASSGKRGAATPDAAPANPSEKRAKNVR